jgi:hypothetical protein
MGLVVPQNIPINLFFMKKAFKNEKFGKIT